MLYKVRLVFVSYKFIQIRSEDDIVLKFMLHAICTKIIGAYT